MYDTITAHDVDVWDMAKWEKRALPSSKLPIITYEWKGQAVEMNENEREREREREREVLYLNIH